MFQSVACYSEILMDEICLEGLDGITLESLWIRLNTRFNVKLPDRIKLKFWSIIKQLDDVEFYQLPKFRPSIDSVADSEDNNSTVIYPFCLVPEALGSCKDFFTRINITREVQTISLEEVLSRWNNGMVIVGGAYSRWRHLSDGQSVMILEELNPTHYGLLERIGRSRFNGERTTGEYSLWKLCKDVKNLFYHRKKLSNLGLITEKPITFKNFPKILLIHLQRFNKFNNKFKNVKIEAALKFLNSQPTKRVEFSVFKKYMIDSLYLSEKQWKHFQTSPDFKKHILTENNALYREFYPDATEVEWKFKSIPDEKKLRTVTALDVPEYESESEENDIAIAKGTMAINEPIIREIYLCIRKSQSKGLTLGDIRRILGIDPLTVRLFCRVLLRSNYLFMIIENFNKITMARYYAADFKKEATEEYEIAKNKVKDIFELNESSNLNDSNNSEIKSTTVKEPKNKTYRSNAVTLRKLQRINMIMEYVRDKHVVSQHLELIKYISQNEGLARDGGGVIDKNSLLRLLSGLEKEGQINLIRVKMPIRSNKKFIEFICEPHIHINHPYLQTMIEKIKTKHLIRANAALGTYSKTAKNMTLAKTYGLVPKFARIRVLHEFLFYLVFISKERQIELGIDIQELIDKNECSDENIPIPYIDPSGKYSFVSPLPDYEGHCRGWVIASDIILRIPLWLFAKIINICYHVENLTEYLNHPIKRQLLIKHLPETMKSQLLGNNRHIPMIFDRLMNMCFMGLIKYGKQLSKSKDDVFIYVNSNAVLWDTTSSCPGYDKVEDKDYPLELFQFESLNDVKNYWDRAESICLNTTLGERYAALGEQVDNEAIESKLAYTLKETTNVDLLEDSFQIPGDRCGAGGFDSLLFSHIKKSWSYSNIETLHQIKTIKRKSLNKNIIISYKRKTPLVARGEEHIKQKINRPKKVRIIMPRKSTVFKKSADDIDKSALNVLGPKRCTWNSVEDKILCMFIAARRIMRLSKAIEMSKMIRDILHKCTNSLEKATSACRRRVLFLSHREKIMRNINLHIAEISCYPVYKKYQLIGRQINVNRTHENLEKFKIHFVELINLLYSGVHENNANLSSIIFPESMEDFLLNFNVEKVKPDVENDDSEINFINKIDNNLLTSIIHSALGTILVKDKRKFLLTETYKTFSEDLLASTINTLRASGMISYKKYDEFKIDKMKMNSNNSFVIRSQFKISISYIHNLAESLPYNIYSQASEHINILENRRNMINEPLNGGTTAAIFELLSMNYISLDLTIPDDIIIADYKYSKDVQDSLLLADDTSSDAIQNTSQLSLGSLQIIDSNVNQTNDLCVNSCNLSTSLLCESSDLELISRYTICSIVNRIIVDALFYSKKTNGFSLNTDAMNKIYEFIEEKKDIGRTSLELKENFINNGTFMKMELCEIINKLIENNCIRRVGIETIQWVSVKHLKRWCTKAINCVDESHIEYLNLNTVSDDNTILNNIETTIADESTIVEEPSSSEIMNTDEQIEPKNVKKRKLSENIVETADKDGGPTSPKKVCSTDIRDDCEITDTEPKSTQENKETDETQSTDCPSVPQWSISNEEISKVIDLSSDSEIDEYMDYISKDNNLLIEATQILNAVYNNEEVYIFSRPWIKPDGSLNNRLLWSWMGAVLNYLLYHPTSKMISLVKRFKFLLPYQLFLIIEILEEVGCVKKVVLKNQKASLFSTSTSRVIIEDATILDFDDDNLYLEVLDTAILKFALFKGNKT